MTNPKAFLLGLVFGVAAVGVAGNAQKAGTRDATCEEQRDYFKQVLDQQAHPAVWTALLEPGSAPLSAIDTKLLNMARPGLGSALDLMTKQAGGMQVRWVMPGALQPFAKDSGLSFAWINAETNELVGQPMPARLYVIPEQAMIQKPQTEKHCLSGHCAACPDGWKLTSTSQETYCVPAEN